jgi:pimeloyl-ACP methyl ester carboxylesterase
MGFWNDAWRVVKGVPETIGELGKSLFVKDLDAITNVSNLGNSLDSRAKTYVIIHGYQNTSAEPWVNDMAAKLHQKDSSANVLALNWLYNGSDDGYSASNMEYNTAASRVVNAGEKLAHYLKDKGIDPANVTIIGHSLGAHVAAYAGKETKEITGKSLSEIIGLDPAGPGFDPINPIGLRYKTSLREGLNPQSADRVIAFHTNPSGFGTGKSVGHVDFDINPSSIYQPGTGKVDPTGNHSYAHKLYTEMIGGARFKQNNGDYFDLDSLKRSRGNVNVSTTTLDNLDPLPAGSSSFSFSHLESGEITIADSLTNPDNGNSDASKIEAIRNADIMGMNNGFEFGSDRLSISNSWGTNNDSPISNSWGMVSGVSDSNFGTQRNPLENTDSAYGLIKTDDFVTAEQRQLQAV